MDGRTVSARALLRRCRESGLLVRLDGGELQLRSPKGPPPPHLLDALRANKPALVNYLREARTAHVHPCAACGDFYFPEPATLCYGCRRARSRAPVGPPCDGCGEACERCLGHREPEVGHET